MNNIIKTIAPIECPHCKKNIFVEFTNNAPELSSAYGESDVLTAKADVLLKIGESNLADDKKQDLYKWVNDPETIFGPSEVQAIIDSILKQNEKDPA